MKTFICAVMILSSLLSGCAARQEHVQQDTTPTAFPVPTTTEDYLEAYSPVLDLYARAMDEGWTQEQYLEEGLSVYPAQAVGVDVRENLGVALVDLDGDGVLELLLHDQWGGVLIDGYRLEKGEPVQIFAIREGNEFQPDLSRDILWEEWHLCREETGNYFLYHKVQKNWLFCGYFRHELEEAGLAFTEGYLYDSGFDANNPWYQVPEYTLTYTQEQSMGMDEAGMAVYMIESAIIPVENLDQYFLFGQLR